MTDSSAQKKILIVDDDPAVVQLLDRYLQYNHYQVQVASDARSARLSFYQFNPNLVILDVNLPDESGFQLCRELRKTGALVLMLTCMSDTDYVLEGFEQGADEYLTKPFDLAILKAKIGALFKRSQDNQTHPNIVQSLLTFDQISIDVDKCEVLFDRQVVPLTNLEYDLLYFLACHPNRVWDRSELIHSVWNGETDLKAERKVDVHIGQIRKKIGDLEGKLIKTVRGKGYIFDGEGNGESEAEAIVNNQADPSPC